MLLDALSSSRYPLMHCTLFCHTTFVYRPENSLFTCSTLVLATLCGYREDSGHQKDTSRAISRTGMLVQLARAVLLELELQLQLLQYLQEEEKEEDVGTFRPREYQRSHSSPANQP